MIWAYLDANVILMHIKTIRAVHADSMHLEAYRPPHRRSAVVSAISGLSQRGLEESEHSWVALEFRDRERVLGREGLWMDTASAALGARFDNVAHVGHMTL